MRYLFSEAFLNVRQGGMVSVLAILIVALATMLFGALNVIRNVVRGEVVRFEENPAVVVFVKDDVSEERFRQLAQTLDDLPEVERVVTVSKNEAFRRSHRLFAEASAILLEGLEGYNPFPRSIELYPFSSARRSKTLEALVAHLRTLPELEGVLYEAEGIQMMERIKGAVLFFGVLVGVISMAVISFSIMLTIYVRREELGILRLIGATNAFIRLPLMLQGFFEGLLGSGIGMGLFYLFFRRFGRGIGLLEGFLPVEQILLSMAGAAVLGFLGGWIPLRNRLREM